MEDSITLTGCGNWFVAIQTDALLQIDPAQKVAAIIDHHMRILRLTSPGGSKG